MGISPRAIEEFRNRKLESFDWLKAETEKVLDEALAELDPAPVFHTKPFIHQKACFLIGVNNPNFMFFLDMGLGKTKISLDLIAYQKETGCQVRALILVPNTINLYGWEDEWVKHQPALRFLVMDGSSDERWKMLEEKAPEFDVAVLNYAGLVHMVCSKVMDKKKNKMVMVINKRKLKDFIGCFTTVVYDESTALKNHKSLIYAACRTLSRACDTRYALTGTPFGRDPSDLWAQFYAIDFGETLGKTLGLYREVFCTSKLNYFSGWPEYTFDKRQKKLFRRTIKNKSIFYETEECQNLPKQIFTKLSIPLSKEQRGYYDDVLKGYRLSRGGVKQLESSFVNLRCICSGFLMFKVGENSRAEIAFHSNPKLDAFLELVDELPYKSKMVVFHEYIFTGAVIKEALDKKHISSIRLYGGTKDKKGALHTFQRDPKCKILIVNNATGAKALNLQMANYVVFFEGPVSPINRQQAEKRAHRIGQTKTVYYYDLCMKSSVDWKILAFLKEGKDLFDEIIKGKASLVD